jgi:hypothetical protein
VWKPANKGAKLVRCNWSAKLEINVTPEVHHNVRNYLDKIKLVLVRRQRG